MVLQKIVQLNVMIVGVFDYAIQMQSAPNGGFYIKPGKPHLTTEG